MAEAAPMRLQRRKDWRSRLSDVLEARRRIGFAWGQQDCGLLVADCIEAMTGVDLAVGLRGRYASAEEARAAIRATGAHDLAGFLGGLLEEISPVRARVGDVAAFRLEDGSWSLGMVNGERVTVLRPDGLGSVSLTDAAKAFRVP